MYTHLSSVKKKKADTSDKGGVGNLGCSSAADKQNKNKWNPVF